jgi:beta-lactamase superfamily II metal-dependent hydrolase
MLNVGNADAIIVQLNKTGHKLTLLVDGGKNQTDANTIIKKFETLKDRPNLIICTHLDKDHIGGLGYVVAQYYKEIEAIWVHSPKKYDKFLEEGLKIDSLAFSKCERREQVIASLKDLDNFIKVAEENGLGDKIFEPFYDNDNKHIAITCNDWSIKILGPSRQFYRKLLSKFLGYVPGKSFSLGKSIEPCDMIGRDGYDRPENEASLIFQISDNGKNYLFTGDAGLQAFEDIEKYLSNIFWLKVSHHGSAKNLNAKFIKKLAPKKCFISAAGTQDHPNDDLVACLKRHHAEEVLSTNKNGDLTLE